MKQSSSARTSLPSRKSRRGAAMRRWGERLRSWRRGGVRLRIAMAMLAVLVALSPAFVLALYYFAQMRLTLVTLTQVEAPLAFIGERMVSEVLAARQEEKNYMLSGSSLYLDHQGPIFARLEELIERGLALGDPWRGRFSAARLQLEEYRGVLATLAAEEQGPPARRALQLDRLRASGEALVEIGRSLAGEGWRRTAEARKHSLQYAQYAQRNLLVALTVSALLAFYFILSLPRLLVLPLRRQLHALQQAAQGDYSIGALPRSADEIGELSLGIERLLATVKKFDSLKVARIRENETKFRLLADRANLPVAWIDADLIVRYTNRAFTEAVGAESEGASVGAALSPKSFEDILHLRVRGRDAGELPEVEPVTPTATTKRFHARADVVHGLHGDTVGFLVTLTPVLETSGAA